MVNRSRAPLRPELAAAVLWLAAAAPASTAQSSSDRPPEGVEQLLPRGRIAAIFEPEYVAAETAEIPDEAWILGIEIGGEARAYSLALLNSHEVVNDRIGDTAFAAVW